MQRVVINFDATPLTADVQRIIMGFYAKLCPVPQMNVSQDVRELIIGADIFGFLWGMITDKPRYRTMIVNILQAVHEAAKAFPDHPRVLGTVMMFLAVVTKRHRGRMSQYMDDQPLRFSRGLPNGGEGFEELWYDWGKRCQTIWWEEAALACHEYFAYKGLSYHQSYNNEPLMKSLGWGKIMRAIITRDDVHARLTQVGNLEEFYEFVVDHSMAALRHFDSLGIRSFSDLEGTPFAEELSGLKNMACEMVAV